MALVAAVGFAPVPPPATTHAVPSDALTRTTLFCPVLTMYTFPDTSAAIPCGEDRRALTANSPLTITPDVPYVPAKRVTAGQSATAEAKAVIFRTTWLLVSAMNRLPLLSIATPLGLENLAVIAGLASPVEPATPVPATVLIAKEHAEEPAADTFIAGHGRHAAAGTCPGYGLYVLTLHVYR